MAEVIRIGRRRDFSSNDVWEMHRLRTRMFKERLGSEVSIVAGMEIDNYDALDPHYMIIRRQDGNVCGCWRLLPTQGPYMLKNTFPELLHEKAAPEAANVWELSRFAIETEGPRNFRFAILVLDAMRAIVKFGGSMGIDHYVTVANTAVERLLRHTGIAITRYGPPRRIGDENTVALNIDIGEQTRQALFGNMAGSPDPNGTSSSPISHRHGIPALGVGTLASPRISKSTYPQSSRSRRASDRCSTPSAIPRKLPGHRACG